MDKRFAFVLATIIMMGLTIFCLAWALIFNFDPINPQNMSPMFPLLWCAFAGLGLVVAAQGTFKTLPNMLFSACCGPFYGMFFYGLLNILMGMGLSAIVSFAICAIIVTYVLALLHVVVLRYLVQCNGICTGNLRYMVCPEGSGQSFQLQLVVWSNILPDRNSLRDNLCTYYNENIGYAS